MITAEEAAVAARSMFRWSTIVITTTLSPANDSTELRVFLKPFDYYIVFEIPRDRNEFLSMLEAAHFNLIDKVMSGTLQYAEEWPKPELP